MLVNQHLLTNLFPKGNSIEGGMSSFPSVNFDLPTDFPSDFSSSAIDSFDQPNASNGKSFEQLLDDAIGGVSKQDQHAMDVGLDFALNRGNVDVHQVMIEQAKATAQLHVMSAVTNKLASSYQTLMNMQV